MRRVFWYVRTFENRFAEELQNRSLEEQKKEQEKQARLKAKTPAAKTGILKKQ